jgi:phage terminase large subunit-like protein
MTPKELYKKAETSLDELAKYSEDVINNSIISCQKHKLACRRFLNDLKIQGTSDFPYIFDVEKANKFMKWMTFFKHTKGPLAGQPKIPELIEKFIFANIYGWVNKDTGYRRFRKSYWRICLVYECRRRNCRNRCH